jgi:hypothetical protein
MRSPARVDAAAARAADRVPALQFVFEVTATTGSVGAPEVVSATPERTTVVYRVEW